MTGDDPLDVGHDEHDRAHAVGGSFLQAHGYIATAIGLLSTATGSDNDSKPLGYAPFWGLA